MSLTVEVFGGDPGGTTGLARFLVVEGTVKDWEAFEVSADGAAAWLVRELHARCGGFTPVVVAFERFVITPHTARKAIARSGRYDALELIGVARHLCKWYGHDFALQSAGDAKGLVSNDHIRAAGWWTPRTDGHALDATRHAVLQLATRGFVPPWLA